MVEINRRLAGILAADVVSYSARMGADDAGTLARVRALRTDVIEPLAATHGGRLFKTMGDGFLLEFASAVQALQCAIAIQTTLNAQTDGLRLRIGVHQGEVVPEGDDLFGDGVIIAARLEPLAEPGGICISSRVREDASGKMALEVIDLGEPTLKNIAAKIRVFRVQPRADVVPPSHTALTLPDKPSLAVLAFDNMSGDAGQEYFSDGIAEDIITQLSHSTMLFVIARNSSFTYKGRAVDVKQIGRDLGVRYVLQGSVRRAGERLRISAQLVEAETGSHVWAERFDRLSADVFAVQDEITNSVALAIEPAISRSEQERISRKPPESLGAWEAYQRGLWHRSKATAADSVRAREFFRQAISLDSAFAAAYSETAKAWMFEGSTFGSPPIAEAIRLSMEQAEAALAIDPLDAEAYAAMSSAHFTNGDFVLASVYSEKALAINPNSPMAARTKALPLVFGGHPAEGRQLLRDAVRLNPRDLSAIVSHAQISLSYYFERDYINAADAARRNVAAWPTNPRVLQWLVASLGQLCLIEEAAVALRKLEAISPGTIQMYWRERQPFIRPEDYEHMLEGFRKAGWVG